MAVSLKNRKNTRIVVSKDSAKLFHHGHNTCTINYNETTGKTIKVDLCGWDTVTTRGKINAFIDQYSNGEIRLYRNKGETYVRNYGEHFEYNGPFEVSAR